ncbi:MAG: thermonuclease family protein [Bauldia litoralis]
MDGADRLGEPVTGDGAPSMPPRRAPRGRAVALGVTMLTLILAALAQPAMAQDLERVPRATRNVTPPGILPGPAVDGPLYREPTPPAPPQPPKWRRFFLPRTTDGATFITKDGLTIKVYGVTPPAVDQTCQRADGETWPCGRTALFSLRMFLRGRAVECFLPPLDGIDRAIAPCRVGQIDVGWWLLSQGWATPDDNATDEYRATAQAARCERVGMWRGAEPDPDCPGVQAAPPS